MLKRSILAVALCWPAASLNAQHAIVLQKLSEWNSAAPAPDTATLQAQVRAAATRIYADSATCPASPARLEKPSPATAERSVFRAVAQRQMRNAWTVIAQLPGCDPAPVRFMVMQDNQDKLSTIRVNRGRSYAWDSLIGDTLPLAQLAAEAALRRQKIACDGKGESKLGVVRMAFEQDNLGPEVFGIRYVGSWAEAWPIAVCGRVVDVTVEFNADGDGGAYTNLPGERATVLSL